MKKILKKFLRFIAIVIFLILFLLIFLFVWSKIYFKGREFIGVPYSVYDGGEEYYLQFTLLGTFLNYEGCGSSTTSIGEYCSRYTYNKYTRIATMYCNKDTYERNPKIKINYFDKNKISVTIEGKTYIYYSSELTNKVYKIIRNMDKGEDYDYKEIYEKEYKKLQVK